MLPKSAKVPGPKLQGYLVTVVVPASAVDAALGYGSSPDFRTENTFTRVTINNVWPVSPLVSCANSASNPRDVQRHELPFGWIESCLDDNGTMAVRMLRLDDTYVYCETVVAGKTTEAERILLADMCGSMQISWHADESPDRFRFPCTGWLVPGANMLDEPALVTRLECPPESQSPYPPDPDFERRVRINTAAAVRADRAKISPPPRY
jgi:hypothetical protein